MTAPDRSLEAEYRRHAAAAHDGDVCRDPRYGLWRDPKAYCDAFYAWVAVKRERKPERSEFQQEAKR